VLTAEGHTNVSGIFSVDVPSSLLWSWQADNFAIKVEVFVSLDYDSHYPHTFKGSAYSMAIVGKQRGAGLVHFTQVHTVSNDPPAMTFAYSSPDGLVLRITTTTNRPAANAMSYICAMTGSSTVSQSVPHWRRTVTSVSASRVMPSEAIST